MDSNKTQISTTTCPPALAFHYHGKIIPYTRQTRKSKYVNPRHRAYNDSRDRLAWLFKIEMGDRPAIPDKTPFRVVQAKFVRKNLYTCDLDNLVKAVLDALQGVAFKDDRYCVGMDKLSKERGEDYFEILLVAGEDDTKG